MSASAITRQLLISCRRSAATLESSLRRPFSSSSSSTSSSASSSSSSSPPSSWHAHHVWKKSSLRKTTQLKDLLHRGHQGEIQFLMEAHNGLSARIVEETGFRGIWGSGLSISASTCKRDSNELAWTQVLETLEHMSDVTTIPILLDADTGYGNFNNARLLVRKLESRGIAGACIEDKLFPKTNSLLAGTEAKPLAPITEFADKIRAMKDTQVDHDFVVVARVEAFIAGWPLEEALKRAHAYVDAGADAILMHSKKSSPEDIESFCKAWNRRAPVIIVPTKYYTTPTSVFQNDYNVSTVIWANHNLRAATMAMQKVCKKIFEESSLKGVEEEKLVVPVKEIFRLQDQPELDEAEKKYLPKGKKQ